MKTLKQTLLASALIGLAGVSAAHASTKDGLYLTPNAEVIFVGETFTKGVTKVGVGFGGGLNFGYQLSNFQFELAANYQYYGGEGTITQAITSDGQAAFAGLASLIASTASLSAGGPAVIVPASAYDGTTAATTVDSTEHFIPVTLGVNYVIPFNASGSFSVTPGLAGGLWFHSVKRTSTTAIRTAAGDAIGTATTTTDEASETKGVIVPSLAVDYAPTDNFTLSLASKFYIVPSGYSDNYSDTARATATTTTASFFAPVYATVDDLFWYGSIHFGTRFTF